MSTTGERGERDLEEYVRSALDDFQSRLWTGSPGIVKSVDMAKQTCTVQLSIKTTQRMPDGSQKQISIPVLQDVPMQFPGGGGAAITFPVKPGDECFVHFASRSPDSWQQSGGEQAPVDSGMHSLSGGFASMGFKSNPEAAKMAGGADPDAVQVRSMDGKSSLSLKPGGDVSVKNDTANLTVSTSAITGEIGGTSISVQAGRVDLGGPGGSKVMTLAGPSPIVYAKV